MGILFNLFMVVVAIVAIMVTVPNQRPARRPEVPATPSSEARARPGSKPAAGIYKMASSPRATSGDPRIPGGAQNSLPTCCSGGWSGASRCRRREPDAGDGEGTIW